MHSVVLIVYDERRLPGNRRELFQTRVNERVHSSRLSCPIATEATHK